MGGPRSIRCMLFVAVLCAGAQAAANKHGKLDLRGKIHYAARSRPLRVTLFSLESASSQWSLSDPGGGFHFSNLDPGTYSLSVMRRGLGEIRRTVVITPSLADSKGVIQIELSFSPSEAAQSPTGALVSRQQLAVPDKAREKYIAAQARLAKHDLEGAIKLFHQALEIAPKYMAAWNYLGVLSFQHRDYDQAREYFGKALEIEPNAYEPTVNMGGVLLALRKPQESLQYDLKAAQARPREALPQSQAGIAYFQLADFDKAWEYLEKAKQLDPAHVSQPQLYLADIYARRGDRSAAVSELEDLLARRPDAPQADLLRRRIRRLLNPPPERTAARP
jgi:tetratricopeptide (TPR) repeat protein